MMLKQKSRLERISDDLISITLDIFKKVVRKIVFHFV